jgi:limonene-1,2-epoxide hydrolase
MCFPHVETTFEPRYGKIPCVTAVERYLEALRAHDFQALRVTLAPDVERFGPYNDDYRGRDEYAGFLEQTVGALRGYELIVDRIAGDGTVVLVELSETVDDRDGRRLRTDEAVVFDLDGDGLISRVAVYLRASRYL